MKKQLNKFRIGSHVIHDAEDDHPVLGRIQYIVVRAQNAFLHIEHTETVGFDSHLQAYEIFYHGNPRVDTVKLDNLLFYQPVLVVPLNNMAYIPLRKGIDCVVHRKSV